MRYDKGAFAALAVAVMALAVPSAVPAAPLRQQTVSDFVVLPGHLGVVRTMPGSGPAPHVAVIYENGSSELTDICQGLAARGLMTLCVIEPNHPAQWEDVAKDVKAAVLYARAQPGVSRVVLYGHSGGGAVASFYEATAETGAGFCRDPKKLHACAGDFDGLPPVDAVVFPDAHPGLGVMALREINPSLSSDGTRVRVDPALDPYSPANGFNPTGPSHYPAAFVDRYSHAQAQVMTALIAQAQRLQAAVRGGEISDPRADAVTRLGPGFTSHLDELDPDIAATETTVRPEPLLRDDGSIVVQPIHSVSVGNPAAVRKGPVWPVDTLPSGLFLGRGSTTARDSFTDVDVCSSNANTACNVRYIRVPVLFIPSGANNFIGDDERMFLVSPAKDKSFVVVQGALHSGAPCTACETRPGEYAHSQDNLYDDIAGWIGKRF